MILKALWKFIKGVIEIVLVIVVALGISFLLRTYVVEAYEVPTGSMIPTIEEYDRILSEKITYRFEDPEPGDIVTFANPTEDDSILVKRVIAVEGDVVDIYDGNLYINGELQEEDYVEGRPTYELSSTYNDMTISYPYTVPEGCIWVMGDNRTNSSDSRYFGAVDVDTITGRVFFRYWPFDRLGVM